MHGTILVDFPAYETIPYLQMMCTVQNHHALLEVFSSAQPFCYLYAWLHGTYSPPHKAWMLSWCVHAWPPSPPVMHCIICLTCCRGREKYLYVLVFTWRRSDINAICCKIKPLDILYIYWMSKPEIPHTLDTSFLSFPALSAGAYTTT